MASVGNLEVVGSGVRSGKRRLLLCKEVENEMPVVWYVCMEEQGGTDEFLDSKCLNEKRETV